MVLLCLTWRETLHGMYNTDEEQSLYCTVRWWHTACPRTFLCLVAQPKRSKVCMLYCNGGGGYAWTIKCFICFLKWCELIFLNTMLNKLYIYTYFVLLLFFQTWVAHLSRQEAGNHFDSCLPRKGKSEKTLTISGGKNLEGQLEWF